MHVYSIQSVATGEVKNVHVVRFCVYADKHLEMTASLEEVLQHAFSQGEFEMAGIVDVSEAEEGQGFEINIDWVRFDKGESSRKSLAIIWDGAP